MQDRTYPLKTARKLRKKCSLMVSVSSKLRALLASHTMVDSIVCISKFSLWSFLSLYSISPAVRIRINYRVRGTPSTEVLLPPRANRQRHPPRIVWSIVITGTLWTRSELSETTHGRTEPIKNTIYILRPLLLLIISTFWFGRRRSINWRWIAAGYRVRSRRRPILLLWVAVSEMASGCR
jgi:hypothetical protein